MTLTGRAVACVRQRVGAAMFPSIRRPSAQKA